MAELILIWQNMMKMYDDGDLFKIWQMSIKKTKNILNNHHISFYLNQKILLKLIEKIVGYDYYLLLKRNKS